MRTLILLLTMIMGLAACKKDQQHPWEKVRKEPTKPKAAPDSRDGKDAMVETAVLLNHPVTQEQCMFSGHAGTVCFVSSRDGTGFRGAYCPTKITANCYRIEDPQLVEKTSVEAPQ